MARSSLLSVRQIDAEIDRLLHTLGDPACSRPGHYGNLEGPHLEVDANGYHYVVMERGAVIRRVTTRDLDDLLFEVFSHMTFELAGNHEVRNRLRFKDCRRLMFSHQEQLLGRLSPAWAHREAARHAEILKDHPFDDLAGERADFIGDLRNAGVSHGDALKRAEDQLQFALPDFWADIERERTGLPLTDSMVTAAETTLGYRLPLSFIYVLSLRNGGTPRRCCFPTTTRTSWGLDHVRISSLFGIAYEHGLDGESGSRYLIQEWGYPEVGIIVADTPSAGHDMVMLDYSLCGPQGEPRVIHVETECDEPVLTVLAADFAAFAKGLLDCSTYDRVNG